MFLNMSKRRCGYVFLGVGLFFVLTGVICGFLIPKIVVNAIESVTDSVDDQENKDLVNEKADISSKIYYWEIKNKDDFMYNGKMPELKERGPYVYKLKNQSTEASLETATFLKEDSCSDCLEDDNITVLNIGYLQIMALSEGDLIFALLHLPLTIKLILRKLNYTQLGNADESIWPDESGWKNPGFGAWLRQSFTAKEMKGLYDALGSHEILFGDTLDKAVRDSCSQNLVNRKCGLLLQLQAAKSDRRNIALLWMIHTALCSNSTNSCFQNPAAGARIFDYILHVSAYTMWYILHEQDDIVTTMSQKKLALGYDMMKAQNPITKKLINVLGLVNIYLNVESIKNYVEEQSIYAHDASEEKRRKRAAFNESETTSSSACNRPEGGGEGDGSGYMITVSVPHSKTADKPCSFSQELPINSFDVSLMETKLTMRFKEDTSLYGLKLKRFTLQKTDFLQHCDVRDGLIDLVRLYKFPVLVSLPHFLYSDLTIPVSFNQHPDEKNHQSIYDVEPVTGIAARAELRFQFNLPIKKDSVSVPRLKALNITNKTDVKKEELFPKGIPFAWIKQGGQATKSDISTMKKKVIGVLTLSCGLFIALPILGGIFLVVFIVLFVLSFKAKQTTGTTSPS